MPGQVIFDDNFKPTPGNEKEVKGNVVAIGHNAKSYNSSGSTVVGEFSNIDNSHWSTALGAGVTVTNSSQSVSIGNNSTLTDSGASVAVGQGSKVFKSDQSQAIGFGAAIYGGYENGKYIITQGNIALGTGSGVDAANNSVALGSYSKVTKGQDNVVSVGSTSLKRKIINVADGNIAVGSHDAVTGGQLAAAGIIPGTYWKKQDTDDVWDNVIIGEGSHISTDGNSMDNVVVGSGAYVNAKTAGTVVLGRSAGVGSNSSYALAIGKDSGVGDWAENSMALGTGAKVEAGDAYNHITNAVALGSGSIANAANTVSFGSDNLKRRLTNVADGVNPNDAVNKSQMEKADQLVKENVTSTFNSKFQQLQDSLSASGNDTAANATAIANLKIAGVTGGTVTNSNSSIALGKGASVTYSDHFGYDDEGNPIQPGVGPWNSIAIGQASSIEDSANSIVIGGGANGGASGVINSNNGIALGSHSHVKNAKNGVAIGANTGVHAEGSVALGAFSSAKDPYTISVGRQIGDPDSDGDAAKSAVTRRIVNVAAGTGDNDAVIVSQFNGKGGAGDASFLSAVGKIDWKAVGEKADAINAAVEKMGGTTTTTTATKSLANAKFSLLSAVQPTMLAADETAPTDEATGSREPVKKDDGNTSGGTGSTPTSISGITTSANAVSVDRDLDVTGNATVGKELTVKGNSTFEGTAKFQKGADMGNNKVTNVADGAVDKDSKDAINGSQLYTEQQDRIAGDNALGGRIDTLSGQVNKLGGEIDSVGAISAALAGLHPLDYNPANSKYQLAAAFGGYDGSYALALGGFYNVNQDILLSGGVSTILKGERKTAGNVGVTFRVGAGNSAKDLGTPADLKEANQQLAALKQDNKVLTGENRKLAEKVESQDQKIADLEAKFEELLKKVK